MEIVQLIASLIAAAGVCFGFCSYWRDSRRKAKIDTLEAYRVLQATTFSRINEWAPSEIREAAENKQSSAYKELSVYLAEIERFCIGINNKIYDFNTFYQIAHGYFDSNWGLKSRLAPILAAKLERADMDYFENLHKVWKRMDEYK